MINPYASEFSALCTVQNIQDLSGCPLLCTFLVMTSVDMQFPQGHAADQLHSTFVAKGLMVYIC